MNLQNLVDFCQGAGIPDPFSGASVPAPLNLDAVKSAIMIRCGLLTPIYGEPDVFRNLVTQWFFNKQWTFEHIINIIQSEYSPIENVFEERTDTTEYGHTNTKTGGFKDTNGGKDTVKDSGKDTVSQSGTDQRDISNSGTDTTTNTISAFNSSTYQPDNESATLHGHAVDDDITYGKSEDTTYGKQTDTTHGHTLERVYNSEKDTQGGKDILSMKRHGNIGITSADDLINQELELLRHFDAYGFIAELFEKDNMIMIY